MAIEYQGKTFETDDEGYLQNWSDWSESLATEIALQDGIKLTNQHWEVINILRDYYHTHQIAPAVRILTKTVGRTLGEEKGNSMYLFKLFPGGPAKQACKYAGMPKPTGCV